MHIAVSGSIATDYLMTFPGTFRSHLVEEQLEQLSLSFLVDSVEVRRGGVAANICFGMGRLGLRPLLVGAVGEDFFSEYEPHLREAGVDTSTVYISQSQRTAMFLCTTDSEENQIASFCPGAMGESGDIDLTRLPGAPPEPDLVVVCPNDPSAMLRHTRQTLENGWQLAADPSQQLPRLSGDEIRELIDGATYLLTYAYEASLITDKTGWSPQDVLSHVELRITTHGEKGCVIEQAGEPAIEVPAVPPAPGADIEPTGVGDAFRAGFLAARAQQLPLERCAQLGAGLATTALETIGPQEYSFDAGELLPRLARAYGDDAAAELEPMLTAPAAASGAAGN